MSIAAALSDIKPADLLTLSDVSMGWGTPQVLYLTQSLAAHYGVSGLIVEPDQSDKPPQPIKDSQLAVRRLYTQASPYSWDGRKEYCLQAAAVIDMIKPKILVVSSFYPLPALFHVRHRPQLTIYLAIEHVHDFSPMDGEIVRAMADRLDLVIFPEANRARIDGTHCGLLNKPMAIVYNTAATSEPAMPASGRNGRIFYGGTVDRNRTYAEYYLAPELKDVPIDLYGPIQGDGAEALANQFRTANGKVRYHGVIRGGHNLQQVLRAYSYSIVCWAPNSEGTLFAAPNKLFDAIACGVPPIAAPHPQCEALLRRYKCGILMDGWSLPSFVNAMRQALALADMPRYNEMVENCRKAFAYDLNWGTQFDKMRSLLPTIS